MSNKKETRKGELSVRYKIASTVETNKKQYYENMIKSQCK